MRGSPTTPEQFEKFLKHLALTGRVLESCGESGVDSSVYRKRYHQDKAFKTEVEAAHARYNESLEKEIHRRAVEGVDVPVHYKGERCDTTKEYSDALLTLLARRRMPEYREKALEVGVTGGVIVVNAPLADSKEWESRAEDLENAVEGDGTEVKDGGDDRGVQPGQGGAGDGGPAKGNNV